MLWEKNHLTEHRPSKTCFSIVTVAMTTILLQVKRREERHSVLPEDLDWAVYLTEAQKSIITGHLDTALCCANKVNNGLATSFYIHSNKKLGRVFVLSENVTNVTHFE